MGTTLELQMGVKPERNETTAGTSTRTRRRLQDVKAWLVAVIFLGVTGITTSWAISAPPAASVMAEESSSSEESAAFEEEPSSAETAGAQDPAGGLQDPSRMMLLGAALIAIAAAVRRVDSVDKARG